MSSSKNQAFRNVPPPPGAKPANAYTRFIPREELGEVASWRPGTFGGAVPGGPGGAGVAGGPDRPSAAHATAEPTPLEWQARVNAARQAGHDEGYRRGLADLESFKKQFAGEATAQVGALLEAFDQQLSALDARLADTLTRTALQLAREVVRSELATRPELVARVAAEAVGAVMLSAKHITIFTHPHDLPLVAEGAEETLAARGARLLADAEVARGGVRIESDVGRVDAGIARRWNDAVAACAADSARADSARADSARASANAAVPWESAPGAHDEGPA